ncbi:MAG TPA: MBL fold metallo-hydrolase [Alphaproteobacteria bacterium]|nr:MBL fold metallo-hydrolase [Alphaproteobacteria bacterium]
MSTRVTILGCGNSTGVPMANGDWGRCDPAEPRNRRRRASILVEKDGTTVLIDAGPDMRDQLLSAGVNKLDAVIFTHAHADHSQGTDDLRAFVRYGGTPLPIYGYPELLEEIRGRFSYLFGGARAGYYDKPFLQIQETPPNLRIGALDFSLFEQDHTVCRTLGVRVGSLAYSTDVKNLPEAAFQTLAGIETWIIAAVRREPHIAHAHLDLVLEWIARVQPRQAFLTHLNLSMDYTTLLNALPAGVEPAYDGKIVDAHG